MGERRPKQTPVTMAELVRSKLLARRWIEAFRWFFGAGRNDGFRCKLGISYIVEVTGGQTDRTILGSGYSYPVHQHQGFSLLYEVHRRLRQTFVGGADAVDRLRVPTANRLVGD